MADDRRRWRRPLTVRARTTIAATLVVGVAAVLGGAALISVLRSSLVDDIDQVSEVRAADIAALARQGQLPSTITADQDEVVQVLGSDGGVIASSENIRHRPPVGTLHPIGDRTATSTIHHVPGNPGTYRLLALRGTSPTGPVTVLIATSLKPADAAVVLLRTSLFIGAPLLLALVAITAWITVGWALRPVEAIRNQVADISRHDLARRVPVPNTGDELHRLAGTMNDMLGRLQASFDQQRRFVADASHELQTPLAATRAELEVALTHPDAADWVGTARTLLDGNERMERLVANLLFVARADDDTPLPTPTPIDLHEVVLGEVARVAGPDRVRIDTSGVTASFVLGWRDDLGRAVRNLLDNAERHAAAVITVELWTVDRTVTLAVEDDGGGVPPEHRERIFDRFTRLDDARSCGTGGAGLGLAIVKEIAERHHGNVTVVNGHARGARFVLTLPAD
jgi:signal transduction histidine kinase